MNMTLIGKFKSLNCNINFKLQYYICNLKLPILNFLQFRFPLFAGLTPFYIAACETRPEITSLLLTRVSTGPQFSLRRHLDVMDVIY